MTVDKIEMSALRSGDTFRQFLNGTVFVVMDQPAWAHTINSCVWARPIGTGQAQWFYPWDKVIPERLS